MGKQSYSSNTITVTWDSEVCIHSSVCVNNLGTVFNLDKKPWIDIDAEDAEKIKAVIGKCPSGALTFEMARRSQENTGSESVTIKIAENGPLLVKGSILMEDATGTRIETKASFALCRCGASENKPFCDGSHKKIGFKG